MCKGLGGNIGCRDDLQLERCGFCVQERSLPIKSALSFTAVASREISSIAALMMKLLLPIEIHVAVYELQATHKPTITPTELRRHSFIAATWFVEQRRCTGRRPPRCTKWFWKT